MRRAVPGRGKPATNSSDGSTARSVADQRKEAAIERSTKMAEQSMEQIYKKFPDVHQNIVLKTEMLRVGIDVSDEAIKHFIGRNDLLWKGFHMFSYDWHKTKVYGDKIPWFGHLEDGCIFMVRTNEASPYIIDLAGDEFVIREKISNEVLARKVWFERKPRCTTCGPRRGTRWAPSSRDRPA